VRITNSHESPSRRDPSIVISHRLVRKLLSNARYRQEFSRNFASQQQLHARRLQRILFSHARSLRITEADLNLTLEHVFSPAV